MRRLHLSCLALGLFACSLLAQNAKTEPAKEQPTDLDRLISDLSSEHQPTIYAAAFALADSNSPKAVVPLVTLMRTTKYQGPADCASISLARLGGKEAVAPLTALLKDDRWYVRKQAAWTLGRVGTVEVEEALVPLLRDEAELVRLYAVWALGRIQSMKARELLVQMAKEEKSEAIRQEASRALDHIKQAVSRHPKSKLPAWILLAGQDIPIADVRGIKMSIEDKTDHLWGFTVESEPGNNLEVTPFSCGLIVHRGKGKITSNDLHTTAEVSVE